METLGKVLQMILIGREKADLSVSRSLQDQHLQIKEVIMSILMHTTISQRRCEWFGQGSVSPCSNLPQQHNCHAVCEGVKNR